jgi:hypothetical protein
MVVMVMMMPGIFIVEDEQGLGVAAPLDRDGDDQ